jgi:hypothetical protein
LDSVVATKATQPTTVMRIAIRVALSKRSVLALGIAGSGFRPSLPHCLRWRERARASA